jgi:hypothetical protein
MPVSTIDASKDSEKAYQPLLLVTIVALSGQVLRLCTQGLGGAESGFPYGGQTYLGRIAEQDLGALQGHHEGGIDVMSRVSIRVIDPDKVIYLLHQAHGFRGATMQITFLLYDAATGAFSSDSIVPFEGIVEQPGFEAEYAQFTATSSLNLQRVSLPRTPQQRRCPWINPTTLAERAEASSPESLFFYCGETRDLTAAPPCDYTRATCTQPARRGGLEYDVPTTGRARNYLSGQWLDFTNNPNAQRWGQPVPLVYGTAWVDGKTSVIGEGNSTRGEAILCEGEVDAILRVVVNGSELPPANDITGALNYIVRDPLMRYNVINRGGRDGAPNADSPWNGTGDPYGSMCAILWVLYSKYADPAQVPSVQALVRGARLRVYTGTGVGDFTREYSENPVWVLVDLLVRAGVALARLDLQTFIDAAAFASAPVSYTDQYGNVATHARYACSLVVSQRQSAADLIRRVRLGCGARLVQNPATGKIQIFMDSTLATQQPAPVPGSNYNVASASLSVGGAAANGYFAYDFTRVLRMGGKSTLKESGASQDPPNAVQLDFTNSERDYASDAARLTDAPAVKAAVRRIDANFDAGGINTLDQAKRIGRRQLSEVNRANSRGDAGGSDYYTFLHTMGTVRLRPGHICRLSDSQSGLSNVPIRVLQLRPARNWETAEIYAQRHVDAFYLDSFGQDSDPLAAPNPRNRLERPAYPWCPRKVQPIAGDSLTASSEWTFNLAEDRETAADGTSIAKLIITGALPVNQFAAGIGSPIVARQGTVTGGGSVAGGGWVYYAAACAVDADGLLSAPSSLCQTVIAAAGSTHAIAMTVADWPAGTVGWVAYIGNSPGRLTRHSAGAGTPASIVFGSYPEWDRGLPDVEFDRIRFRVKRIAHSGVWGAQVTGVGAGTLIVAGAGWVANQWVNRDVTLLAHVNGVGDLQVYSARVTASTADTLTVAPSPAGVVAVGDVVVMRATATGVGAGWVEDGLWINSLAPAGLAVNADQGKLLRIIAGTGRGDVYRIASNTSNRITIEGDWLPDRVPDATTRHIVEDAEWVVRQDSDAIVNSRPDAELSFNVEATNYSRSALLVQAVTLDGGGLESVEALSPTREIYLWGGAGEIAGGGATPLPGDVAVGTVSLEFYAGPGGERRVLVTVPYTAPVTADFHGFNGVELFAVRPAYDDPTPLDPTGEPAMDQGWFPYSGVAGGGGQAVVDLVAPDRSEGWIFYLAAGRDQVLKAQPWPGTGTVTVGASAAVNVTSFDVAAPSYATGRRALVIPLSFVLPSGASWDVLDWDRCEIHVRTASIGLSDKPAVAAVFDRGTGAPGASVSSQMEIADLPDANETWTFTAVSFRLNGDRHAGAPTDTADVTPPPNAPATAGVTGFSATVVYSTNESGVQRYRFEGSWVNPASPEFVGVEVTAVWSGETKVHLLAVEKEGVASFRTDDWPVPESAQTATIYAFAVNVDGLRSAASSVSVTLTPNVTGTLKGNRVAAATLGPGLTNDGSQLRVPVGGISESLLASLSVTTGKLANLAVDVTKLADLSVEAAKLASSSVTATKIANAAVGSAAIAAAAIGTAHIANAAIVTAHIQDLSVTSAKIQSINADKITAGTITASVLMTSPSIDINTGAVRVQIDSSSKMKVSSIFAGSYTTLNGDWVEVGFTSGSSVATMSPATFGVTYFGSIKARLGQVSGRGLLDLFNAGGGLSVEISAGNYAKFSDPVTCSSYLRVDGQLRIAEFFAHGTGSPASPATHKAAVYDEFGTFLGFSYLYP